jgi:putative redox protein
MAAEIHLATVHTDSREPPFETPIRSGSHTLVADESPALGGNDAGPPPYGLLLAALGACTSITLRMYAARKGWELGPLHVDLHMFRGDDGERIERTIRTSPSLTAEQRTRLGEIAEKTPVTRTLARGTPIATTMI